MNDLLRGLKRKAEVHMSMVDKGKWINIAFWTAIYGLPIVGIGVVMNDHLAKLPKPFCEDDFIVPVLGYKDNRIEVTSIEEGFISIKNVNDEEVLVFLGKGNSADYRLIKSGQTITLEPGITYCTK